MIVSCLGAARKTRLITRRKSTKAAVFKAAKKSFLAPTSCSTVKQRSKIAPPETPKPSSESHTGVKPSTIPVSPHFRVRPGAAAAKTEVKFTSEELMLQKLESEKAQEAERAAKAKKLYEVLKARASRRSSKLYGRVPGSAKKATPKKEKKFVKPRKVATPSGRSISVVKKGPGGLTLVEPFCFATDKRIQPSAVPAAEDVMRAVPAAELAQQFMRDSRSHGVGFGC
jgi:hypothetical protein